MRSSKYGNKKGVFGSNKKAGASKRTSEMNEDFLAEFRELERIQQEMKDIRGKSQSDVSSYISKNSAKRNNQIDNGINYGYHNNSGNFTDDVKVRRRTDRTVNKGTSQETRIFSKEDIDRVNRGARSQADNVSRSQAASASRSQAGSRASNQNAGFQKKTFDSEKFERNAMQNGYEPQGYKRQSYDDNDYLSGNMSEKNNEGYGKKGKKKSSKNKKERSTTGKKIRKVLFILLLLLAVCGAGIYYYIDVQLGKLGHMDTDVSQFEIDDQVQRDLKDYRNIAVMGVDARAGQDKNTTRTDAIIVASLNKKTGDVSLISVMRDSYLEMDSSTGDPMFDKITHAHVYGGPINTCKSLNKALDLNISEFVVMDWQSVADTVDALGGITVDVQQNEIYDLNHWGPETAQNTDRTWNDIYNTGEQRIDGAQAATYCRIRKNSGGDTGRTERMRKVIMAILKEVKSNPSKITTVADKVLPEITTNMGTFDITSLLPQVINFNISNSIGYPYNYYGGSVGGSWKAVPTTLSYNAIKLHKEAFKQEEYMPTPRLEELSQRIINNTGISEGYEEE